MSATTVRHPRTKRTAKMGRVTTKIVVENAADEWALRNGVIKASEVRRITIDDALVDTGAAFLTLPKKIVKALGLKKFGGVYYAGIGRSEIYGELCAGLEDLFVGLFGGGAEFSSAFGNRLEGFEHDVVMSPGADGEGLE